MNNDMNQVIEVQMMAIANKYIKQITEKLAGKYGFNAVEALAYLDNKNVEKKMVPYNIKKEEVSLVSLGLFDSKSEDEFKKAIQSGIKQISSAEHNKQLKKNGLILLANMQTEVVFGVAIAEGPPVKRGLIDNREIYSELRYNKHEIPLKSVFIFPRALEYSAVNSIIGIDSKVKTSWRHYHHLSKGGIREVKVWSDEKEAILDRLVNWIKTYLL